MSFPECAIAVARQFCPLCRGEGFVTRGASVVRCPECCRRGWEEFEAGLQDLPPCWGYASCREECMALCPWAEGCREASP